ncbi:MAG: twin-arginine translocase TatA/TatE family subunit [Actinomycetes bacterium]|jgi:Sec-independent protein translocase protein TatA|nr:twin-arginine translocase TatA/TatE family subunit [Actinomycetes bacterium]
MLGIGGNELFIIAVVALLLFGPDKIPAAIKTVRKALRLYNDAKDQVTEVVTTQVISPEELELLQDPLGVKKLRKDMLLTPERQQLLGGMTGNANTGGSASPAESLHADSPATDTDARPQTVAGSIWASLTDVPDAPNTPDAEGSDS